MKIGDKVTIKSPFNLAFPDVYEVIGIAESENTYTIGVYSDSGSDFNIEYLEIA